MLLACGLDGMDHVVEVTDEKTHLALKPNFSALAVL
jgi:hypothetical protein